MSRIPTDDGPTYRRNVIRRRKDDERPSLEPDAHAEPGPAPIFAQPDPEPVQPASEPPPSKAAAPPPGAGRDHVDAEALADELANMDPDELARLMGMASSAVDFESGDEVSGPVVRLTRDTAFVDLGAKSEAWLPRGELDDQQIAVGDTVKAFVLSVDGQGIRLTTRLAGSAARDALEAAAEGGIPVQGTVESRNEGGFTIALAGTRAFCPVSQIDRHPGEDLDRYLGMTLGFRILELRGRDVVVSHRVIAEEQAEANATALWERVAPGDSLEGTVVTVKPYGVFVDLGGVTGLVHKSEAGWDRDAPLPARGTRVKVRVLEVDRQARRLSLSLKDEAVGPWSRVGTDFVVGGVYEGTVRRVVDFGAFVALAPGLEGLVHISNMADRRVDHPSELLKLGQKVQVRLMSVDRERDRLELGMRQAVEGAEPSGEGRPRQAQDSGSLGTMAELFGKLKLS